jgi:hypothetical protein
VARSVSRLACSGLVATLGLGVLSGCDTTQDKSARAGLVATRMLVSRIPLRVGAANPGVTVRSTALVRSRGRLAVAVRLANRSGRPLNDLPIAVWLRRPHGPSVQLNRSADLLYFQTHLPGIAPGRAITWIFTSRRPVTESGTPFVRVGTRLAPRIEPAKHIPSLSAEAVPGRGGALSARVSNDSGVPQYGLEVYASAVDAGRLRAAGSAIVEHLGPGHSKTVRVPLVGHAGAAPVTVEAPSTIFG